LGITQQRELENHREGPSATGRNQSSNPYFTAETHLAGPVLPTYAKHQKQFSSFFTAFVPLSQ
jgi:hypothetical protein